MTYTPSKKMLDRYAHVMVNFALGNGKGIKRGDTVYIAAHESAKPLFIACRNAVTEAGGHVISNYMPDEDGRRVWADADFFKRVRSKAQLEFFPQHYMSGLIADMDHSLYIDSYADVKGLAGVDAIKMMARQKAMSQLMEMRSDKENQGKLTWTICLYGTPAMAQEAGLTLKEYWNQIIKACQLDKRDPIAQWQKLYKEMEHYRKKLNVITQKTEQFHMYGPDCDLWITPGEQRQWLCGRGANIPSFEIYTSPDRRKTHGWIRFNQSLYFNGSKIEGVELHFKNGKAVKSSAKKGEKVLKQMIATKNANMLGEYSLTDARHSRITKFMATTLFDENVGGKYGNTHVALGNSYVDTYTGDIAKTSKAEFERLGYNYSPVHTDIMSTAPRTVVAHLNDGTEQVIYKNGNFVL